MIRPATNEEIQRIWDERWGVPIITPTGRYRPTDVSGLILLAGEEAGLVTWACEGATAEIVTLDGWPPGQGHGTRLLEAAEDRLRQGGVARLMLVTTNDNPRALRFYIRQGYRLVRLHLDAMDRVRQQKPSVPQTGAEQIPLRDMWELEKWLDPPGASAGEQPDVLRRMVSSGSPFEDVIGFSRAVRVGDVVAVSGTAPIGDDGATVGVGDLHLQTRRCIEVARRALVQAGACLDDVVRTRVLLTRMERWEEAARAHREAVGAVRPACTFVQVAGLIDPDWLVEIEVDAILRRPW